MTSPEARALPGPVSSIRLTYTCEQGWWDTGADEPEIWHVAADLYDWEAERNVEHVGDFEFYRADPYATRDLFGVLDGSDGDVGVIAESILNPATGYFRDDLDEYAEPFGSGMLLLNSAQLERPWRGFGVGAVLAGKAIARLGAGARGAACYPSPLDRAGLEDAAAHDRAVSALQRTWSSLGVPPLPRRWCLHPEPRHHSPERGAAGADRPCRGAAAARPSGVGGGNRPGCVQGVTGPPGRTGANRRRPVSQL